MSLKILSIFVLITMVVAIYYRQHDKQKQYSIFKPLTTILIIVISILVNQKCPNSYTSIIIPSLLFALLGDIFLLKKKYFLYGLSSFLVAHIGFTWAFVSINGFSWGLVSLFILLLAFIAYFSFLKKYLKKYTLPVIIYMLAIIVMSWQAIELLRFNHDLVFIGIAIASILFFISDGLIAYKKFVKPFRSVEVFILSTYWIAIYVFSIAGLFMTNP